MFYLRRLLVPKTECGRNGKKGRCLRHQHNSWSWFARAKELHSVTTMAIQGETHCFVNWVWHISFVWTRCCTSADSLSFEGLSFPFSQVLFKGKIEMGKKESVSRGCSFLCILRWARVFFADPRSSWRWKIKGWWWDLQNTYWFCFLCSLRGISELKQRAENCNFYWSKVCGKWYREKKILRVASNATIDDGLFADQPLMRSRETLQPLD